MVLVGPAAHGDAVGLEADEARNRQPARRSPPAPAAAQVSTSGPNRSRTAKQPAFLVANLIATRPVLLRYRRDDAGSPGALCGKRSHLLERF